MLEIDKIGNQIKIQSEKDNKVIWDNRPDIRWRIHNNYVLKRKEGLKRKKGAELKSIDIRKNHIWFVVHKKELWDIDNRLIGFWNPAQLNDVKEDDIIIYYRTGVLQIMGIFKVIKKQPNINPAFYLDPGKIKGKTIYQCQLELITDEIICLHPTKERRFSFFDSWVENKFGWFWQVFQARIEDLNYIISQQHVNQLKKSCNNFESFE